VKPSRHATQPQHGQTPERADVATVGVVSPEPSPESDATSGAIQLVNVALRQLHLVLGVGILFAAIVGIASFLQPRTYTSTASFVPQSSSSEQARVAGLAASFGIAVGTGTQAESPQFYADLLTSDEILERMAARNFTLLVNSGPVTAPLATHLEADAAGPDEKTFAAIKRLRELVSVRPNLRTSVVEVSVRSWSPRFSQELAQALLDVVNEFNLASRQSRAAIEREFVDGRLNFYRGELQTAENGYEAFLRSNRQVNSPELQLQQGRHQRRIAMLQEVVTSLASAYEQSRIEEVRSTPAIRVIQRPRVPVEPNPRGTIKKGLLAGVIGVLLGLVIAVGRERLRYARERGDPDIDELVTRARSLSFGWLRNRA
jgi:uncharacterized protein involved in exopolysaccharide biosynthesis